ncbi:spermidine synthase [Andreprevotia lacus DSM 23236]|jgi:spermidine synthase|uniref:Spermidine synthase n=1 Tax=Andreprevotia lacus DSM 23236 TaxID=1121001 RepID=A0A1W1XFE4_9NEIS|nr:fused MFS/spermidine synthase [Andreprevotia lacus]SMC22666.1 spermidine synthase [Andreprevotia lacus DSM 23236]
MQDGRQTMHDLKTLDILSKTAARHAAADGPFCVDVDDYLSLHFDHQGIQSMMKKSDPLQLVLPYTEAMLAFALFCPQPADILIVGLGGGSLPKFCAAHFPQARITTLEIDARVIALRQRFGIPDDSARFRVIHADAAQYLASRRQIADVILLDGYDRKGIPAALSSQFFYDGCHLALRQQGVLVSNFTSPRHAGTCMNRLRTAFDQHVYRALAKGGNNLLALAVKDPFKMDWAAMEVQVAEFKRRTGVGLLVYLMQMREYAQSRSFR